MLYYYLFYCILSMKNQTNLFEQMKSIALVTQHSIANDAVIELLTNNVNFTSDFLTIQDESGDTPLSWSIKKTPRFASLLLSKLLPALSVEQRNAVFNARSEAGETLLSLAWKNYQKSGSGKTMLQTIFGNTDMSLWTWLDQQNQPAASGFLSEINKQVEIRSDPFLLNLFDKVVTTYPQKNINDPFNSKWKKAVNVKQVENFIKEGLSLNDKIVVNELETTAVEYLTLIHSAHFWSGSSDVLNNEQREKVEKIKLESKRIEYLVPKDHRAKIGYVNAVLAEQGVNEFGQNSLTYLLKHRSDLTALFISEVIKRKTNVMDYIQKDKAGYTNLMYQLFSPNTELLAFLASEKPVSEWVFGCEDGGVFNHANNQWFEKSNCNGYSSSSKTRVRHLVKMFEITQNVELFFGDASTQEDWVKKWDTVLAQMSSWKTAECYSRHPGQNLNIPPDQMNYFKQAYFFLHIRDKVQGKLNPVLEQQLNLAGFWVHSMMGLRSGHELSMEERSSFGYYNKPLFSVNDLSVPNVLSPGIKEFIRGECLKDIFKSSRDHVELVQNWMSALERLELTEAVLSVKDPNSFSEKKRKI